MIHKSFFTVRNYQGDKNFNSAGQPFRVAIPAHVFWQGSKAKALPYVADTVFYEERP